MNSIKGLKASAAAFTLLLSAHAARADLNSVASSQLQNFVMFAGGGANIDASDDLEIGGHTAITGNIGSNQDLFMQGNPLAGYPAQLNGSAYAGRHLTFGQDLTVGNVAGPLREVVANGNLIIGGGTNVYGNVYGNNVTLGTATGIRKAAGVGGNVQYNVNYNPNAAIVEGAATTPSTKTFSAISLPAATNYTAGGVDQNVPAGQGSSLPLTPNTYGSLATSAQNQTVILSSGNYFFDDISTQGDFKLQIDLTSGNPCSIFVVGNILMNQHNILQVKGAGTGGAFVDISAAPALANLIYFETHGRFVMPGSSNTDHNIWGGTVYASTLEEAADEIVVGQYTDWYGQIYAFDSIDVADHGTWNQVTLVPEPASLSLLALGALTLLRRRRCS